MSALIEWFEQHPHLIGEGSAEDNAIRLLEHAYTQDGAADPNLLSASTLIYVTDDGGEKAHNGWVYRGREHSLAARLGLST